MAPGGTLKFKKPKTKIALSGSKQQGLSGNRVTLTGNKKKLKKKAVVDSSDDDDVPMKFPEFPNGKTANAFAARAEPAKNRLSKFDKLVNSRRQRKNTSKFSDGPPAEAIRPMRTTGLGSFAAATPPSRAPADISDSESDSGMSSVSSSSSMPSNGSLSSFMSSVSSSSSFDVPLDDSMSIMSGQKKTHGGARGVNMFNTITSKDAEEAEKSDLLARFHLLKQRGIHVAKTYTPKSSLNEMRMEMGRIEHEAQVAQAIKNSRRLLISGVSAFETLTNNYGPRQTRGKFYKVSAFVTESIKDYDPAFERMTEHYGGIIGAITGGNPIYEIAATLGFQLMMYAFFYRGSENAAANEELTLDDIKRKYPALVREAAEKLLQEKASKTGDERWNPPSVPSYYPPPTNYQQEPQAQQQQQYMPPTMEPPSINASSYYMEQVMNQAQQSNQPSQPRNINTETPMLFTQQQIQQPVQPGAPPRTSAPIQPNTFISEMHQPLPHMTYDEHKQQEDYESSMNFGGPQGAIATRVGTPTHIIAPGQRFVRADRVPIPDSDSESGSGSDEDLLDAMEGEEVVIDIH